MLFLVFVSLALCTRSAETDLNAFLGAYSAYAEEKILNAIGNEECNMCSGCVVAAVGWRPYNYSWVRDAALVMSTVVDMYAEANGSSEYAQPLADYATRVHLFQMDALASSQCATPNEECALAEPKFNPNGTVYNGPWGRPQPDGPGLRALSLMKFASAMRVLHPETADGYIADHLYKPGPLSADDTVNPIKRDLEYLVEYWDIGGVEPWEETHGQHFYVKMVTRRALLAGAQFARSLGDAEAADRYEQAAVRVEDSVGLHWNAQEEKIMPTLEQTNMEYKSRNLDIQVLLAVLHTYDAADSFYAPTSERLLSSMHLLQESFEQEYRINAVAWNGQPQLGAAIGRYPEDRYDGSGSSRGNPWFLATNAYAEYCYRLHRAIVTQRHVTVTSVSRKFYERLLGDSVELVLGMEYGPRTNVYKTVLVALLQKAESHLERVRYHVAESMSTTEQYHRDSGYERGATDLTWSYASLYTANALRTAVDPEHAVGKLRPLRGRVFQTFVVTGVPALHEEGLYVCGFFNDDCSRAETAVRLSWRRATAGDPAGNEWAGILSLPHSTLEYINIVVCRETASHTCLEVKDRLYEFGVPVMLYKKTSLAPQFMNWKK